MRKSPGKLEKESFKVLEIQGFLNNFFCGNPDAAHVVNI